MTEYSKHLSEPWFSLIKLGKKTCEGRLKKGDFAEMKKGDIIKFENNDYGFVRSFRVKITSIHNYNSFREYLVSEKMEKCLPGISTLEQGITIYYQYYKKEEEDKYKIVALRVKVTK